MESFYPPKGEADILTPKEIKAGSLKGKYPIYIEKIHATFYTTKKLRGKKLKEYIQKKIAMHYFNIGLVFKT